MQNYLRLLAIVEGIKTLPQNEQESAYRTVIDMLWQNVPLNFERYVFSSLEIKEIEEKVVNT